MDIAHEHLLMLLALQVSLIFMGIRGYVAARITGCNVVIENATCVWTRARRDNVGAILHESDSNKDQYQQPLQGL